MCGLGIVYPKTHNLDPLFHLLSKSGAKVPVEYEELLDLVDFSVQYRYEVFEELPIYRREIVLLVTHFIEHVTSRLAWGKSGRERLFGSVISLTTPEGTSIFKLDAADQFLSASRGVACRIRSPRQQRRARDRQ